MSETTTKRRTKSVAPVVAVEPTQDKEEALAETGASVIEETATGTVADDAAVSNDRSIETDTDEVSEQLTNAPSDHTETAKKRTMKRNLKVQPTGTAETTAPEFKTGDRIRTDLARVWPTSTSRQPIRPVSGEFYVQLDGAYDGRILIGQDAPSQNTKPIGWIDIAELRK